MELTHLELSWQRRAGADGLLLLRKVRAPNKGKAVAPASRREGKPREDEDKSFLWKKG